MKIFLFYFIDLKVKAHQHKNVYTETLLVLFYINLKIHLTQMCTFNVVLPQPEYTHKTKNVYS